MSQQLGRLVEVLGAELGRGWPVALPSGEMPSAARLAEHLREHGLHVQSYALCEPGVRASDLGYPFLYLLNGAWRLYLPVGADRDELPLDLVLPGNEIIERDSLIVGQPPVGRRFQVLAEGAETDPARQPDIFGAYAATSDASDLAEEQLLGDLQALLDYATQQERELIFIDAVGLIPEKTVQMCGGDEQTAFEKALAAIRRETEGVSKGRAHYEANPLWGAVYQWLAERRVRCVLEELDYKLWKEIVEFDKRALSQRALTEFISGFPEQAAATMQEHIEGFHELNCRRRELNLKAQIDQMMGSSPPPVLIALRELGHYGVLEQLMQGTYSVHSKILGRESFSTLLKAPGLEAMGRNMGVRLSSYAIEQMMFRLCIVPSIMKGRSLGLRQVAQLLDRCRLEALDSESMAEVLNELHGPLYLNGRRRGQNILEQLLSILKDRGLVAEEVADAI